MAARLLAASRSGLDGFVVGSAGTWARPGAPMEPAAAAVVRDLGGDPDGFAGARPLTAELVAAADLVLAASREHRATAVSFWPKAVVRVFTIREFGRLVGSLSAVDGDEPVSRARALVAAAAAARGRGAAGPADEDDIPDPYGGPPALFRLAGELITDALRGPVEAIRGAPAPYSGGSPPDPWSR
jgi:protein-tyrosine phosphatase